MFVWIALIYRLLCLFPDSHVIIQFLDKDVTDIVKLGVHGQRPHVPGFLRLLWIVCQYVCVRLSVCASTSKGINNQWHDMVWYRPWKKNFMAFPAFNYFIWHFPLINWMGVDILTQHVVNTCQRNLRWRDASYKKTIGKTERFIYKSEWANIQQRI